MKLASLTVVWQSDWRRVFHLFIITPIRRVGAYGWAKLNPSQSITLRFTNYMLDILLDGCIQHQWIMILARIQCTV